MNYLNKKFRSNRAIRVWLALIWSATASMADEFRVDFDTGSNSTLSANWNVVDVSSNYNPSVSNLVDWTSGNSTGVSLTLSGWDFSDNMLAGDWSEVSWVPNDVAYDYLGVRDYHTATVVFGNLTLTDMFRIEVLNLQRDYEFDVMDVQVEGGWANSTFTTYGGSSSNLGEDWVAFTDGWDPQNWLIWDNVSPDANGNITITVRDNNNEQGEINGIRFALVPEPASVSFVFLGLLALCAQSLVRRKKSP